MRFHSSVPFIKQLLASTIPMLVTMILASHHAVTLIRADHILDVLTKFPSDGSKHEVLVANAMNTSSPILLSDDGAYAWQFAPYQNNEGRLLTVLSTTGYNMTIVWIANRHHPVSPNASLFVQLPSHNFLLRDADGSVAWSSDVVGITTVLMNSSGNLIMFNTHNTSIWQSFDFASDVLVPGQIVRTNHSVVSRLSLENVSEGNYTLHILPGGAVMYASFDWQQHMVPYVVFAYTGQLMDASGSGQLDLALHSMCNHTDLIYRLDGSGIQLQQEGTITQQCKAEIISETPSVGFATRLEGIGFRYLRLMPYGDIVAYLSTETGVALDNQFFGGSFCKLPSYCGINSLCNSLDNCSCPDMFEPIDSSNDRLGCQLIEAFDCSIASQHQFLPIQGVDYYANAYLVAPTVSSPDKCQSLCRANCSCTTAFYHNETHQCHLYDQVQTMVPESDPSITAFLRVARLPTTTSSASSGISGKVPDPPLDRTYILRRQSRPPPTFTSSSTNDTNSSTSERASMPVSSGINSELEPR